MFKNKKIVAMVLCALMLFVPVAAMAESNAYDLFKDAAQYKNTVKVLDDLDVARKEVATAVNNLLTGTAKNLDTYNKKEEAYQKQLAKAKENLAVAEIYFNQVKGTVNGGETGFAAFKVDEDTDAWAKQYKASQKRLAKIEEQYAKDVENLDLGKEIAKAFEAELARVDNAKDAAELFKKVAQAFNQNTFSSTALKDILQRTWKKYVALANSNEVLLFKANNSATFTKLVKEAIAEADKKEYVASKEGWRVVNKNEGDYLKDVAKVEVVTKDGKSTVKLYDAAGKELKLDRSLYIWIPVAKDTKVLGAKVDGKETTFSVFTVENQKYVEVAAEF